jgi:hypothetical protein
MYKINAQLSVFHNPTPVTICPSNGQVVLHWHHRTCNKSIEVVVFGVEHVGKLKCVLPIFEFTQLGARTVRIFFLGIIGVRNYLTIYKKFRENLLILKFSNNSLRFWSIFNRISKIIILNFKDMYVIVICLVK